VRVFLALFLVVIMAGTGLVVVAERVAPLVDEPVPLLAIQATGDGYAVMFLGVQLPVNKQVYTILSGLQGWTMVLVEGGRLGLDRARQLQATVVQHYGHAAREARERIVGLSPSP